jgi:N-acetylglucosaminyldiphosphoundecaprenol N-acetyl-beta-D-mannosaminyltransferase
LPLIVDARWRRREPNGLFVSVNEGAHICVVDLSGDAVGLHVDQAIHHFRYVLNTGKQVTVDLSKTQSIDPRFFGLFLMVRKQLASQGKYLSFTGVSHKTRRMFRLNRFEFLLSHERVPETDESGLRLGPASTALS